MHVLSIMHVLDFSNTLQKVYSIILSVYCDCENNISSMIFNMILSNTNQREPSKRNQLPNNNKHVRVNMEGGDHCKIEK